MHVSCRFFVMLADLRGQGLDQRHREGGGAAGGGGEAHRIVQGRIAALVDDRRDPGRDQAGLGGGMREGQPRSAACGAAWRRRRRPPAVSAAEPSAFTRRPAIFSAVEEDGLQPRRRWAWIGNCHTPAPSGLATRVGRRAGSISFKHRILGQGQRIALDIEPRRQPDEHAAGEDRDIDVRRLQAARGPGARRPGRTVVKRATPLVSVEARPEAIGNAPRSSGRLRLGPRDGRSGCGCCGRCQISSMPSGIVLPSTSCKVSASAMCSPETSGGARSW